MENEITLTDEIVEDTTLVEIVDLEDEEANVEEGE